MDQTLLQILHQVKTRLQTLTVEATQINKQLDESHSENIKEAEIISNKLQASLNRLSTDLSNYFRVSQDPAYDEVSEITAVQLEAEDVLCEINVKIKTRNIVAGKDPQSNVESSLYSNSKLPKLSLAEFHGDILNFTTFFDQFNSSINNRNLSNVDKLLYLKASLKGEAAETIDGLEVTNDNYEVALEILKNRYGKLNHIIDAHYAALYRVKPSTNTNNLELRQTINDIERHLRVLKSLGEDVEHNHLRFMIMEKFPKDIIYELKVKIDTESIEEMRKTLDTIITAKEDAERATQMGQEENYTTQTLHVNSVNNIGNKRAKPNHDWKRKHPFNTNEKGNTNHEIRDGRREQTRPSLQVNQNRNQNSNRNYKKNMGRSQRQAENLSFNEQSQTVTPPRAGLKRKLDGQEKSNEVSNNKKTKFRCFFCKGNHYNDKCNTFRTVRDRKARLKGRCYLCFSQEHFMKGCERSMAPCPYCKNEVRHNRALCPAKFSKNKETTNTLIQVSTRNTTIFQTAIVDVVNDSNNRIKCRLLMDSGSQRTYVVQFVVEKLNLPIEEENRLSVFTFGSKTPQIIDSPLVKIQLLTRTGKTLQLYANVVPHISQSVPYHTIKLGQWENKIVLADDGSVSTGIDILVGNDYYHSIMNTEKMEVRKNLYLVDSKLGWVLSGESNSPDMDDLSVVTYLSSCAVTGLNKPDPPLDNGNVKSLWDLETIGITDSPKVNVNEEAVKNFNENTELIDNRYTVSWPWIEYPPSLETNYGLSFGRLISLLKRLDQNTLLEYNRTLQEQINKGIIEVIPKHTGKEEHPVHYLPHHCLYQKEKNIRIVYDASAKVKDAKSLNECLYCGPTMLEDLTGLLIKFRYHQIALSADVEKAFLQIALHQEDRDVTRFLWIKDINKPPTEDNLLHMRFCRVPFGIISSPFLLNATIKLHLTNSPYERIKEMANNIYVDNLVTGTSSVKEAIEIYKDSKQTFEQISMNLRDWSSNSSEFMSQIPDGSTKNIVKILGLEWNLKEDTLKLNFKIHAEARNKREVLKVIASVYDPCGFAAPHLLPAKIFLQELWKSKIKWDTTLSEQMAEEWSSIQTQLEEIKTISIPRRYMTNSRKDSCQLHCFTDSSLKAYAAVVYVVQGNQVSFVIGKSRLTPIKDQEDLKIPRLELLGVLIGSRLIKFVSNYFPGCVTQQFLWTDSQIVLDWYGSSKLLPPFVSRRIQEIKRNKELIMKYVPSELNPADVATKPSENKERWLSGPSYLSQGIEAWPQPTTILTSLTTQEDDPMELGDESEEDETSMNTCNEQHHAVDNQINESINLEETKLDQIKRAQEKYFEEEIEGKETSLKRNLGLFLDIEGILRCKGRMKNADWPFDKKYPILLPKDDELTHDIIKKIHNKNYHVGVNHTLSLIRETYWIPQGKSQVQKVLKKCPTCIKHGGGPFRLPTTPALPPERVNYSTAFTFTGLDYLGPVIINNGKGIEKRWICLFTCLAVRAIHLEVVQDLSAEEGLRALRRMIATRAIPKVITSDNALYFKLMSEILAQPYCIENKIKWKFIPALAPWFGGFYERLVAIVKHCMRRTLQKHLLKDSELCTVMKEIEAVVNSRPLTYVDSEIDHILRPSDFLTVGRCITVDIASIDCLNQGTFTKNNLVKSWKRGLKIQKEFREMFSNRYLHSLRERYWHSHKEPRVTSKTEPQIGQIVQLKGNSHNRTNWRVGKIIGLIKGRDGFIRVAKVKTGDAELVRSISHLYPLEIDEQPMNTNHMTNRRRTNITTFSKPGIDKNDSTTETASTVIPKNKSIENTSSALQDEPIEDINDNFQAEAETHYEGNAQGGTGSGLPIEEIPQNLENPITSPTPRTRRDAAVKALEKIREWTQSLIALF